MLGTRMTSFWGFIVEVDKVVFHWPSGQCLLVGQNIFLYTQIAVHRGATPHDQTPPSPRISPAPWGGGGRPPPVRRLFTVVREERKLTYDASFTLLGFDAVQGGLYLVSVTTSPDQVNPFPS